MAKPTVRVPDGMGDTLFEDCEKRHELTGRLGKLFGSRGYREVSTAELEYYELFTRTGSPLPEEVMVKLIDPSGRICVLRPDSTTPIARLAATRLAAEPLPLRLWYAQPVFRFGAGFSWGRKSVWQAGIEHIGEGGTPCDAEILRLAAKTLEVSGGGYHIEIGHAGLLPVLADALELEKPAREQIRNLLERKSFAALRDVLEGYGSHPAARDLLRLTRLSGGREATEEALTCETEALQTPLGELRTLSEALPESCFSFDFAITQAMEYYTGVVFRGYREGAAGAVLLGGRYDRLLAQVGRDAPAIGFALEL